MTALSRMPGSYSSGVARVMSSEQLGNELSALGIAVQSAADFNNSVRANTPESYSLPESVNSLEYLEIKGQDIHSSCFAAALVGVAERQYAQQANEAARFAIWPTYMLAQMKTGKQLYGKDGGTVPPHGIKSAVDDGFMLEALARKYLDPAIVQKWGGDVYPRNYWKGSGNFEAIAQAAYVEACRAYQPLLKNEKIREHMRQFRMPTVIEFKTADQVVDAELRQSATALECHAWTNGCDDHPTRINQFMGRSKGGQHGHHATYAVGISNAKEMLKANSWRSFQLLIESRQRKTQELDAEEWGDDGVKTWNMNAYGDMIAHGQSYVYGFSNMPYAKATSRKIEIDTNDIF